MRPLDAERRPAGIGAASGAAEQKTTTVAVPADIVPLPNGFVAHLVLDVPGSQPARAAAAARLLGGASPTRKRPER